MRIKKAWIDYAEEHGACEEALEWLRRRPRTMKQLAEYRIQGYWQGIAWLQSALDWDFLPREARKPVRKAIEETCS